MNTSHLQPDTGTAATTPSHSPTGAPGPALATFAQRAAAAAGIELDALIGDLYRGERDPRTPAALRAGWDAPDTPRPASDTIPEVEA